MARDKLRCAVVPLPCADGNLQRLIAALREAEAVGRGDLAEVQVLAAAPAGPMPQQMADAAQRAAAGGFDWLLAIGTTETPTPDIFVKSAPALRIHDAVWGAAALATASAKVERITRLAAQDLPTFFHAALRWWIGPSHFVRPALAVDAAQAAKDKGEGEGGTYADYLYALWKGHSAYKTAQALTVFHAEVPPVDATDRARLVEILEREPAFMPVRFGDRVFRLPYTGLNPVIEREQMRGLFFEQEELTFLAETLPRGMHIADVGANTGNHTVFFAGAMQAERVLPVEPLPRSIAALQAAVSENRLGNVDLSCLGRAVGAEEGMLRPVPSLTAGLGAMHFAADPAGDVPLVTLDRLISGKVDFLKLDVEGMEMQALAGAAGLIAAQRPMLYIEVLDTTVAQFLAWVDRHGYRIIKLFPDKTHCNYLLVPGERS